MLREGAHCLGDNGFAPTGTKCRCAVILKRRCQLALTRITHQVSRAFDLNLQTKD